MSITMPWSDFEEYRASLPRVEDSIEQKLGRMGDTERREKVLFILMMFGGDLWDELQQVRAEKRKRLLEDLAAEGDEAAAQEWWELYGKSIS